jgi:hypothetical protein
MRVENTCINVGKDTRQLHEVQTVIKGSMHKNKGKYIYSVFGSGTSTWSVRKMINYLEESTKLCEWEVYAIIPKVYDPLATWSTYWFSEKYRTSVPVSTHGDYGKYTRWWQEVRVLNFEKYMRWQREAHIVLIGST